MSQSTMPEEDDIDLNDHKALAAEGDVLLGQGDAQVAIGFFMLAMQAAPQETAYKKKFIAAAATSQLTQHNENVVKATLECLKDDAVDCTSAQSLWFTQLAYSPAFKNILIIKGRDIIFDRQAFDGVKDISIFMDPFFLLGLKKVIVFRKEFEDFLTHLRNALLDDLDKPQPRFSSDIAAALSHYCFYTEYIFDVTPAEQAQVDVLMQKAEKGQAAVRELLVLACYMPLCNLSNASELQGLPADIFQTQVQDKKELVEIAASIKSLTDLDTEGASIAVRAQYEEFPYPRWRQLPVPLAEDFLATRIGKAGSAILSAGCGTGSEPVQFALMFPQAEITAIDLSKNSMAYATRKVKEFGIKNISFQHADILKLGGIGKKFDMISAGGVLHHLKEPAKGLAVLADLLKDDGLMRLGLYSKIARRHFITAQNIVKEKGCASTREGMLRFRKDMPELLSPEAYNNIKGVGDFYSMSMFRDLLFHVQEHCYDLPEIVKFLEDQGMSFLTLTSLSPLTMATYAKSFPRDPAMRDLKNWHAFEMAHQDTFVRMYQFWCVKKTALQS